MTVSFLEVLAGIAVSLSILHIAVRTTGLSDDPRHADFAREGGLDSPRKMFMFLQNQGLGSIALVLAIFVGGEAPAGAQLKNIRTDSANRGRVCDAGLWRWRGERYRHSRLRTSMFVPLPPQQGVVT
jgi:steroid 5-alpha reductase family enzyme